MKARWNIENRVFNNLKNNANLDHCYVHGGNAVEAVFIFDVYCFESVAVIQSPTA